MKLRVAAAACVFVLAAGAQKNSDKPSPVPRRPVRPEYDPTQAKKSSSARSADRKGAARESGSEGSRATSAGMQETGTRETGRASFFSASTNGAMTASGVRLDSEELVAAHARAPLGSWVRAKNVANGQSVEVKIVDRFPESSGRIINVSEAAAKALGFVKAGTAEVELTFLGESPSTARN